MSALAPASTPRGGAPSLWTPEREALATKLRLEGKGSSAIAAELGLGLTKSAVVAKLSRLRIPVPAERPVAKSPPSASSWPQERVARLRELCDGNRTSGEIAAEMGVSRNTIIGKARRLGLPLSCPAAPRPGAGHRMRESAIPTLRSRPRQRGIDTGTLVRVTRKVKELAHPQSAPEPVAIPTDADAPLSTSRPCTIVELTSTHCRWPLGDPHTPEFRFCGAPKEPELSYCAGHARMARGAGSRSERSAVNAALAVAFPRQKVAA